VSPLHVMHFPTILLMQLQWHDSVHLSSVYTDYSFSSWHTVKGKPQNCRVIGGLAQPQWKRWQISKLNADKQTYKNYAVRCRSELYKFQCAKELDMIDKRNVNKFYKFVNHRLGKSRTVQPILDSSTNSSDGST